MEATECTISSVRDLELEAATEQLYSATLPYHNFQHALDTVEAADSIVCHCLNEGIRFDAKVVYYAALLHDAGFHKNHSAFGCESKEAYSAQLATDILGHRGVYSRTIEKVTGAILSTHKNATFLSVEQKVVRAADLSGLAREYDVFRNNSKNLKSEHELFSARTLSWVEWIDKAADVIRFYLAQEIRLTSYFYNENGESAFHQAVKQNLDRLLAERD